MSFDFRASRRSPAVEFLDRSWQHLFDRILEAVGDPLHERTNHDKEEKNQSEAQQRPFEQGVDEFFALQIGQKLFRFREVFGLELNIFDFNIVATGGIEADGGFVAGG